MASLAAFQQMIDPLRDNCPVKAAVDVIRGRWKPYILCYLKEGSKRFHDMQELLPGITAQVLTTQLRQLEADGVIVRTVYPDVPLRVEYALSESGRQFSAVMDELEVWGAAYLQRQARPAEQQPRR
jgi:DNA-binding HxlR family transcriptional regulator